MSRKTTTPGGNPRRVYYQASHNRFEDLVRYCVRGKESPVFRDGDCDHLASLGTLLHDDIDQFLWSEHHLHALRCADRALPWAT